MKSEIYQILESELNRYLSNPLHPPIRTVVLKLFLTQAKVWLEDNSIDTHQFRDKILGYIPVIKELLSTPSDEVRELQSTYAFYGFSAVAHVNYALYKIKNLTLEDNLDSTNKLGNN